VLLAKLLGTTGTRVSLWVLHLPQKLFKGGGMCRIIILDVVTDVASSNI